MGLHSGLVGQDVINHSVCSGRTTSNGSPQAERHAGRGARRAEQCLSPPAHPARQTA